MFRDCGLSSDTSILISFAIARALEAIKAQGLLYADGVRRVGIVGPGLDFTDKDDGYDFYPQQTIQPFAVIDSLIRLGLAKPEELRLTTFDLSPRINRHIEAARQRHPGAADGGLYVRQRAVGPSLRNSERVWGPVQPGDADRPESSRAAGTWEHLDGDISAEPDLAGAPR